MNKIEIQKLLIENFNEQNEVVLNTIQKYADENLSENVVISEMDENEFRDFISGLNLEELMETELMETENELDPTDEDDFFERLPEVIVNKINEAVKETYLEIFRSLEKKNPEFRTIEEHFNSKTQAEIYMDELDEQGIEYEIYDNLNENEYFEDSPEYGNFRVVVHGPENLINEVKIVKKVNARGEKRKKKVCPKGFKWSETENRCMQIKGNEKIELRKRIKQTVRTKKRMGSGYQRKVNKRRNKAMKRRKAMGL